MCSGGCATERQSIIVVIIEKDQRFFDFDLTCHMYFTSVLQNVFIIGV